MNTHKSPRSHGDICPYTPWTLAMLDNLVRKLLQNPRTMVGPYLKPGMTAMDIGCGPGFFTLAMAQMVGSQGQVIAIDVQKEMLDLVKRKSKKSNLDQRILFHQCKPDSLGMQQRADFILSFYMVHEVPDRDLFFSEVIGLLAPGGKYLIVEPNFHVSKAAFDDTLDHAIRAGFRVESRPKIFISRAAILRK